MKVNHLVKKAVKTRLPVSLKQVLKSPSTLLKEKQAE